MRLQTQPFPSLEYADIIPYYWKPRVWIRWQKQFYHGIPDKIVGFVGRFFWLGFVISFIRPGVFRNGSRWLMFFRYRREVEDMMTIG